jgi:hypothetical protein
MSTLLPVSLLESLGLQVVQEAADAAFGPGVLTISADSNGLTAGFQFSSGQAVNLDDLQLGAQGLSGRLWIDGLTANPLSATLGDGFDVALTAFDLTFANGSLAASNIGGALTIPFFTDPSGNPSTVDIDVSTKADGSIAITVSADPSQNTTSEGLVQLSYDLPGGLGNVEIDVDSLSLDKSASGVWTLTLSGNLIITTPDLNWPTIELNGLSIDSKGHIKLAGGWINLPNHMALDFYGFHLGLQQLGFGTDASGDKWIGFSGDIQLVEGLTLGGSVRGLQINLTTGALTLDGVSISFEIPDVLSIEGEIDHIHVNANTPADLENAGLNPSIFNAIAPLGPNAPAGGKQVNIFAGMVKVDIEAAGDLEVDANFIVGNFGGQSVFFLDLDVELPAGIPLFLDISLWGLQGLVATGLEPEPEPNYTWWQWYKYPVVTSGANAGDPDLTATPDYTATDVSKWLVPKSGAFAIGAGATIGTEADDGFTASAAIMLVVMMPGPVISLIGKANILSKRISGSSEDANFEAMATYDGNSGTFDLTIDAQYSIPIVLDIEATAEIFVTANPAPGTDAWFFALGKPPHEKRVTARIFDLFESDAYFVISDHGLVTGTWTGYKNSWSFGPLSASLDAYLATLAAIQWSPLQIGGGIELYGNVHLSAFGIGIGLTADALLEGCAPNPFWIHGELSIELDLPWPLPDIGATISLSWGGDDGSVPPAPLSLSHLDATLADHCDSNDKPASDHYLLLSHKAKGINPDFTAANVPLVYDGTKPGILDLEGASLTDWQNRAAQAQPLPELVPDNTNLAQMAPIVPQDAHFVLNFSHPTVDGTGAFNNAIGWNDSQFPKDSDIETPALPNTPLIGPDDMSNINPTPPTVQFNIRHTLTGVSLFIYDKGSNTWDLVCAVPPPANPTPAVGVTQLDGVWLTGDPSKANPRQVMTQLKVFPWRLLPGQQWTASWNGKSDSSELSTSFTNQNLSFSVSAGMSAPTVGAQTGLSFPPGLRFTTPGVNSGAQVTITFPQPVVLTGLTGGIFENDGEFQLYNAPECVGDGTTLTPQSSSQDPATQVYTLSFPQDGTPITQLMLPIDGNCLALYAIDYTSAPIPMAILPTAPALYSLMTVTEVEAQRVGASNFQTVPDGNPIIEFVYFQTASGPATAVAVPPQSPLPIPAGPAPWPQLSQNCLLPPPPPPAATPSAPQQPNSAFPQGGALSDLTTYTQWSWPQDGAATAYYGYDLNVEFVESYVNALYTAFSGGVVGQSLHFRCVDRNNLHTLLFPLAIHVPSIPQQSALVAHEIIVPLAKPLQPPPATPIGKLTPISVIDLPIAIGKLPIAELEARAQLVEDTVATTETLPDYLQPANNVSLSQAILNLSGRFSGLNIKQINPGQAGALLHEIKEIEAAAEAKAIWFQPLKPSTRYTLDVVAGPLLGRDKATIVAANSGTNLLEAIFTATDAIGVLAALEAYFKHEDSLTTLKRVQFTTSRYATFTAQLANAASQLAGATGATPIRHYVAPQTPMAWLGTVSADVTTWHSASSAYLNSHSTLLSFVAGFSPLADDLQPGIAVAGNGAGTLVQQRQQTASNWAAYAAAVNQLYDGMITAFGHQEMASNQKPIPVPDTEISLFTDSTGLLVEAILLESPEPLPWQRIWRWITLKSTSGSEHLFALWSADGTRALLFPRGNLIGTYDLEIVFQGNLGPELPCITWASATFSESVDVGSIRMGQRRWIPRPRPLRPIAGLSADQAGVSASPGGLNAVLGDLKTAAAGIEANISSFAQHTLAELMDLIRGVTKTNP